MNNLHPVEKEIISLFGLVTPVSVQSYIDMLRDDMEEGFNLDFINSKLRKAYEILKNVHSIKESTIVCDSIKQDIGAYYSKFFQVPFDWMAICQNRVLNSKVFFKVYTMKNNSQEILWQMKGNLN